MLIEYLKKNKSFNDSASHSANLTFVGLKVTTSLEFILKSMSDNILHVLQLTFQVLEFFVVIVDYILIIHVLILKVLSLLLNAFQPFTEFLGQILKILSILNMLLKLV